MPKIFVIALLVAVIVVAESSRKLYRAIIQSSFNQNDFDSRIEQLLYLWF